jgi:RNA recognition motif-containing protein
MSKLYVGNLSYSTTEETLRQVFQEGGRTVQQVSIITDRETGESRGFAFVEMSSPADAQAAMSELDGREVDGRRIRVNEARDRGGPPRGGDRGGPRGPRSGGGGGGGGGGDRRGRGGDRGGRW